MWFPDVVLDSILSHLVTPRDLVQFSIVCKQWHSVAKHHKTRRYNQAPFLLRPRGIDYCNRLYSVTQHKFLDFELDRFQRRKYCLCSSHGWLVFLELDSRLTLLNPFTRAQFSLPPIPRIPDGSDGRGFTLLESVILSAERDFMVAALRQTIAKRELSLIRPGRGDEKWVTCCSVPVSMMGCNIVFDKSGLWVYAPGPRGSLVRFSVVNNPTVVETVVEPWYDTTSSRIDSYLVETTPFSDLLMISIPAVKGYSNVEVFKLRGSRFVEAGDLNGGAVFIGFNYSTYVAARDFQGGKGIEADCIYYSDHYNTLTKFKVEKDDSSYFDYSLSHDGPRSIARTIWINPTLNL